MFPQPLIMVTDVESSSDWYQKTLGLDSGHGGSDYERLMFDNKLVLQLHRWDVHDHSHLGNGSLKPNGNGVALWFTTSAFDDVLLRLDQYKINPIEGPQYNDNARHREVWIRDPDGYVVVIAGNTEPKKP